MTFFKKGELALLWPFYLESILATMIYFAPIFWVVYFGNLNLSMFQVGLLMAMIPLFSLIFEIPTGAVADLYGRKFSVLLSIFLSMIGNIFVIFSTDFTSLLIIFSFLGFAATFYSGAMEAWAVDLIKHKNKNLLHKYFSKIQGLYSTGFLVSGLLGALLVNLFGVGIIWPMAALSYVISFSILIFAKEYYKRRKAHPLQALKEIFQQTKVSINYSRHHKVLFYFLLAGAIFGFAMTLNVALSWIPLLKGLGMPDHAFGYVWSAMSAMWILSSIASHKFLKKGREKKFIINSIILAALFTLLILFTKSISFALVILLAGTFFDMVKTPAQRAYFHKFTPSKLRATVGSVEGMIRAIIGIIALPITGWLVDLIGAKYTIFISGILMIPAAIVYYRIKE